MKNFKLYSNSLLLGCFFLSNCVYAHEQDESLQNANWYNSPPVQEAITRGVSPINDQLFAGTSTNPTGSVNNVFVVDTVNDTSQDIGSLAGVWGATADVVNERILYTTSSVSTTVGGDELFEIPYAGGAPVSLGLITDALAGEFRVDGLAMSNGTLYAVLAGGLESNGFYSIDLQTLVATEISLYDDSISGIDADPDTCIIYGTNDTTGQLVTISTTGAITNVAAYPSGITDIDGIAVGNGNAYLVTDEAQDISVYDLALNTYGTALTSPFAAADTFSGAAIAVGISLPNPDVIFENGFDPAIDCMTAPQ